MRTRYWLAAAAVVVVAAGATIVAVPRGAEWTTSSPAALAALEKSLEAGMKVYYDDARRHLEEALELDPDFVIAKLMLADRIASSDKERASRLVDEALAADREALTPRERLLLERRQALRDKRPEEALALVDRYLEEHRDDPHALNLKASEAFSRGDLETADRVARHILEVSPNWVEAYNQLGYSAMIQGRFAEAEEYLTSYRFIAPEQANPHDSLGELYTVVGRRDEAVASFNEALRIRPDFWASWSHLVLLHCVAGDLDQARVVVERMAAIPQAPEEIKGGAELALTLAELAARSDWRAMVDTLDDVSREYLSDHWVLSMIHQAACRVGRFGVAESLETELAKAQSSERKVSFMTASTAVLDHMQAVRLAFQGRLAEAAGLARSADGQTGYGGAGPGLFKLLNRLLLVEILFAQGDDVQAHQLLTQVRVVNPALVTLFEQQGLAVHAFAAH